MVNDFPELVNVDLAHSLESSHTTFQDLKIWQQGGEKAREITPLGYCGNPSEIDLEAAKAFGKDMVKSVSEIMCDMLKGKLVGL